MAGERWRGRTGGLMQQATHGGGSAAPESGSGPHAGARSRARVVSACELVEDVGDEGADDGDGVGDAAAGAGCVDDECAQGRSVRDADEAS